MSYFRLEIIKYLLYLIAYFELSFCDNTTTNYCVIKLDGPGIIYNSTEGKDRSYDASNYFNATSLILKKLPGNWKKIFSNSSKADKIEKLILDERWEHFENNPGNVIPSLLKLHNFAFSAKIYQNYNLFEKASPPKWKHYYASLNGNGFLIQSFDSGVRFSIDAKDLESFFDEPTNIWKIHSTSFWYTGHVFHDTIYSNFKNCTLPPNKKCVYFYFAMCEKCTLNVKLLNQENETLRKETFHVPAEGKWYKQSICAKSMTDCFSVNIQADVENGFWAIGTMYLSSCQNDFRYLTLNNQDVTGCEDVYNNATSISSDINTCIPFEDNEDVLETENKLQTNTQTNKIPNESMPLDSKFTLWYLLIPATLLVLTSPLAFYWFKRHKIKKSNLDEIGRDNEENFELITNVPELEVSTTAIKRKDFEAYVNKVLVSEAESNYLKNEFENLPADLLRPHFSALRDENFKKNKYKTIVPYDDNRVILKKNLGYQSFTTDYINASYVTGVNSDKEYIVTQNPLPNTVTDFWYMIWQENIEHIVMLSTYGDCDFAKYWPEKGYKKVFDIIEVVLEKEESYEFHTERVLEITAYGTNRKIIQYHFDWWSKSDEYMFSYTLVNFVNKLLTVAHDLPPILVHCHAGIGRAGTLILIDTALRSGLGGTVDMFQIAKKLRDCRHCLLENHRQYELAHLVVWECLYFEESSITLNEDFVNEIRKLLEHKVVAKSWKHIDKLRLIDELLLPFKPCNKHPIKNRDANMVPFIHSKVVLQHLPIDYINATVVDGYRAKRKYITTQQPLPRTLDDFWIMVLQQIKATVIVNLHEIDLENNINYCQYFPDYSNTKLTLLQGVSIEFLEQCTYVMFDRIKIEIKEVGKAARSVVIINMKSWDKENDTPPSEDCLYDVWQAMHDHMKVDEKAIICCDNGVRGCGLFVCYSYIIDILKHENKIDIVAGIRAVRRSHNQFINQQQFVFLYKCLIQYGKRVMTDPEL